LYVASAWTNQENAQALIDGLARAGHEITRDWTREETGKDRHAEYAQADVLGVRDCEAFILLNHPDGRGACTELGLALAFGKPVYVLDKDKQFNIFLYLKEVVPCQSLEELMLRLVRQSGR
jgi:nucleoside 2-deoxyribosyltransferase